MKKAILLILLLPAILLLLGVCFDSWRNMSLSHRAKKLNVGDSKATVRKVLGEPNAVFQPSETLLAGVYTNAWAGLFTVVRETWSYGSRLDLKNSISAKFPYFWPFRFRIFRPDSDDVAIEFDSSGNVYKVDVP